MERYNLHHHGSNTICFKHHPNLSIEQLNKFFNEYANNGNIISLNIGCQENLQDSHLDLLSKSTLGKTIRRLNLEYCPGITYDGIVYLWKSPIFGSILDEEPKYHKLYNKATSIINIEIGATEAINQYNTKIRSNGKKLFPLPLLDKFDIFYINSGWNNNISHKKEIGFKKIILTENGVEF